MSMSNKVSAQPPSYREAMNLPPIPDVERGMGNGRSTPMAVPIAEPFQHDDWGIHHDEHDLRMALRGLHMGIDTPMRTASPRDMRSFSPAPMRSYSPAPAMSYSPAGMRSLSPAPGRCCSLGLEPLPIPSRSFSPAPSTRSFSPGPNRSFSPSPLEMSHSMTMTSRGASMYSDAYLAESYKEQFAYPSHDRTLHGDSMHSEPRLAESYKDQFCPPNGAYLAPLRTGSPVPIITRNRSPSAPAQPHTFACERPPLSPTRYTYPHPSYSQIPPPKQHTHGNPYGNGKPVPSPSNRSNWEYTTQFASQARRPRENSATSSSYSSSYSSYPQRRPRSTSQSSLSQSFTSSFSAPVSPPALSHSATSTSPPSVPFVTPISPPAIITGTSPPVPFPNATQSQQKSKPSGPRPLSPHPPKSASGSYFPSTSPVREHHEHEDDAKAKAPSSKASSQPQSASASAAPSRRPAATRFACISLTSTNRIRGIGLPTEIRALVSDSLLQGPKAGIRDFTEITPGIVEWKIEGHPWQEPAEAPRARRIVKRILATLSSVGWHLVTSVDLSRKDKEKDTLFFREGPPLDREFFAVGFADTDKMMIVDPPTASVRAEFLKVVRNWPKGLQDYGERTKNCYEVKLAGTPWSGVSSDATCHSRLLMLNLLAAMEAQGYELVASVNLNKQRKSETNVDVDSLIFATRV